MLRHFSRLHVLGEVRLKIDQKTHISASDWIRVHFDL